MGAFKDNNISTSSAVLGRQKGKPIIYLEGASDKKIFEHYWFVDYLEKVSFSNVPEANGCAAVVRKVGDERQQGIAAFGLVDRDKLMADRNWALLREFDDDAFESARPYPEVKITRRWELESYLIDPPVLESYIAAADGGRKPRKISDVEVEYLGHADALVPLAALNQALHLHGETAVGDGFTKLEDRPKVDARIRSGKIASHPHLASDYDAALPTVDAFSGQLTSAPRQRLEGLLRIVNGKSMLERVRKSGHVNHDITFLLAREIKQAGRVPDEISSFVHTCIG